MKIITGEMTGKNVARLERAGFGRMKIARNWTPFAGEPWAVDNGAYRMWSAAMKAAGFKRGEELGFIQAGMPGVTYNWTEFEKRLEEASRFTFGGQGAPLFVVVPDLVAQGADSLAFSWSWILELEERLEALDPYAWTYGGRGAAMPLYLAVQDGMTPAMLDALVDVETDETLADKIGGIFLGGSVPFKESTAATWRAWCDANGKRLHYARAGTVRKIRLAHSVGADSADSAAFLWSGEKWTAFEEAVASLNAGGDGLAPLPLFA